MKKYIGWLMAMIVLFGISGCSIREIDETGAKDLDYTVVAPDEIPPEVQEVIQKQGTEPFQVSYQSGEYLYLLRGYGKQKSGGYSIRVEKLCASEETILFKTELIGPSTKEEQKSGESCPYLVVKIPYRNLPVLFE